METANYGFEESRLIDALCDRFEQSLKRGEPPNLPIWLDEAGHLAEQALPELVMVELDWRLRRCESVSAADFFTRYPVLKENPTTSLAIVAVEYRAVVELDPLASEEDFRQRYPWLVEHPGWQSGPWNDRCDTVSHANAVPPTTKSADLPVCLSGRYTVVRRLGKGGMGLVHLVHDRVMDRDVALKELQPERISPEMIARLYNEAIITGRLQHPGIVPVYDLVEADGRFFYTMRPILGRTFHQWIKDYHALTEPQQRKQRLRELLRLFIELCRAIGYAHTQGIIHRDLKGQNVFVDDFNSVVVLDWGLAKQVYKPDLASSPQQVEDASSNTLAGTINGTPAYMPPEQARGDVTQIGPVSDIYSLGAVLYELLANKPPIEPGATHVETLQRVLRNQVLRLTEVPAPLAAICYKALQADPAQRYSSADELAADVQHYLDDEPVTAYRGHWAERLARKARRHRTLVLLSFTVLGMATLTLSIIAVLLFLHGLQIEKEVDRARVAESKANERADQVRAALSRSLRAIDGTLVRLGEERFRHLPGIQPVRQALLEQAAIAGESLLQVAPDDGEVLSQVAQVWLHLAELAMDLNSENQGVEYARRALIYQRERVRLAPEDLEAQAGLGMAWHILGYKQQRRGAIGEALIALDAARRIQEQLVAKKNKADPKCLNQWRSQLGRTLTLIGFCRFHENQGHAEMLPTLRRGVDHLQATWKAEPENVLHATHLSTAFIALARAQANLKEFDNAIITLKQCEKLLSNLPANMARQPILQQQAGNLYNIWNLVEIDRNNLAAAMPLVQKALTIREQLSRQNPEVTPYRAEWASAVANVARIHLLHRRWEEALLLTHQSVELFDEVLSRNPDVQEYVDARNRMVLRVGKLLVCLQRWEEAARYFCRAKMTAEDPTQLLELAQGLTDCLSGLAAQEQSSSQHVQAQRCRWAQMAVECLREARRKDSATSGEQLEQLLPLEVLQGTPGFSEMLQEWDLGFVVPQLRPGC